MSTESKNELTTQQSDALLSIPKARIEGNMIRHEGVRWEDVETRLQGNPSKLWSIHEMKQTSSWLRTPLEVRKLGGVIL